MRSRVLVIGSKEAEEAEQNLEIAFRLLIETQRWGGVVLKVIQGVTKVGLAHFGVNLGVRLAQHKLGWFRTS